jgi:hypothetical protein
MTRTLQWVALVALFTLAALAHTENANDPRLAGLGLLAGGIMGWMIWTEVLRGRW